MIKRTHRVKHGSSRVCGVSIHRRLGGRKIVVTEPRINPDLSVTSSTVFL